MTVLSAAIHGIHLGGSLAAHRRFRKALKDPGRAQQARLGVILAGLARTETWGPLALDGTYQDLVRKVPPRTFDDLETALELQRASGRAVLAPPCGRWQPTSGSTRRRKWLPYPPAFLRELDAAAGAWMVDLALGTPRAFRGCHYWSLSWIPEELRAEGMVTDDLTLLPAWKRWALGRAMAVPGASCALARNEDAMVATAIGVAARADLSLLSVWSPTFALALMETLSSHRERAARVLEGHPWSWDLPSPVSPFAAGLLREWDGTLAPEFFQALWPKLALVSAWDSASSEPFAGRLQALLPQAAFQGKGLWATEGVVTIPFRDRHPLALTSHFLEFLCEATGRVLPAWGLEEGMTLQPLLTTSGGLVRCGLGDRVRVQGFLEGTPCLEFLGRAGMTDLVGEKLDQGAVRVLMGRLESRWSLRPVTLFAVALPRPRYVLLAEGPDSLPADAEAELERELGTFHHYRLARELGQLDPARVLAVEDASRFLASRAEAQGRALGETKPEFLDHWALDGPPETLIP